MYVPVDLKIQHNVTVKDQEGKEKQDSLFGCPLNRSAYDHGININYNGPGQSTHGTHQVEGSPFINKIKIYLFIKFITLG